VFNRFSHVTDALLFNLGHDGSLQMTKSATY